MGAAEALFIDNSSIEISNNKNKSRKERKNSTSKRLAARRSIESYQEEKALNKCMEEFLFDEL